MTNLIEYLFKGLPKLWTYNRWLLEEKLEIEISMLVHLEEYNYSKDLITIQEDKVIALGNFRDGKHKAKPYDIMDFI